MVVTAEDSHTVSSGLILPFIWYSFSDNARFYLENLSQHVIETGIVPELSDLPLIKDPEHALTPAQVAIIDTGDLDVMLRATYELMPDPLRFAIRFGYPIISVNGELREYMQSQRSWRDRTAYFLGMRLGKEPSVVQTTEAFHAQGTAGYAHFHHVFLHRDRAEKQDRVVIPDSDEMLDRLYLDHIKRMEQLALAG